MERLQVVDSHTAGEPTRVLVGGGPDLGDGDLAARRARLVADFDHYRRAIVCEPRGSDVMVGAWLVAVTDPQIECGIIFFNNVGVLGMCGHGTFGVVETLRHLGRLSPGRHRFATPVGTIEVQLDEDGQVELRNVPARRFRHGLRVQVPGYAEVIGDVAWGGNWFFLVEGSPLPLQLENVEALTAYAKAIKQGLELAGIAGEDGAEIDHIEISTESPTAGCDSRNFVLCPGDAYDRSPCGTGTSAKLACLAADGSLAAGAQWVQESICGGVFHGRWAPAGEGAITPILRARAWITAESILLLDPADPFCFGLR